MMKAEPEPTETEVPEASPQDVDVEHKEEKGEPTWRGRLLKGAILMVLVYIVVLAIVLPLTLDDSSDDSDSSSSSSDDGSPQATLLEADPVTPIPEVFTKEANFLNYKNKDEFEADLTLALKQHFQYFLEEKRVPFRCYWLREPWMMSDNNTSDMSTEAPGVLEGDGADDRDSMDDVTDFETNVQEETVDEADIMKADENFVYAAYGNHIVVWDRDGNQVTDLEIPSDDDHGHGYRRIQGLLITDNYLVVIVNVNTYHGGEEHEEEQGAHVLYDYLGTQIRLYLRVNTGNLLFAANKNIHGRYVNARSVGDSVYVQTQSCLNIADHLWDYLPDSYNVMDEADDFLIQNLLDRLEDELKMANGEMPTMLRINPWKKENDDVDFLSSLTQVTSFSVNEPWDENNELAVSASALLGGSEFPYLYASGDKLVLANTMWSHEPHYNGNLTHLVALEMDSHSSRFFSVGTVEGELLNQYALDIVGNELRAATTVDRGWSAWDDQQSRTVNYMSVLYLVTDVEGQMVEKGRVKIGKPNERIMSVRFFDNIAYAVTFERTDPFYVLNMDVPEVLGELSLPGFSSYLHSMNADNSLLVAVGEGGDRGLVVTVFDATDPANPKPLVQNNFGHADSSARWDYKAFRYIRGKLIIPIRDHRVFKGFDGFVVLDVSTDGVVEQFRVSHTHEEGTCGPCVHFDGHRSFVYSGDLMTVKSGIVVSTDLDNGAEVWRLQLELEGENDYCCW